MLLGLFALQAFGDDGSKLLSVDHYVRVTSAAPSVTGQNTEIYAREVVLAGTGLRHAATPNRVVLFIHGAGTPAEVSFDVPYQDYSWMGYLAKAGFDVFAMDMTGYGRSTRPGPMNDPCNLSDEQQKSFGMTPCKPTASRVADYDRVRLERYRGRGRSHSCPPACR